MLVKFPIGNIVGDVRAEADKLMLSKAFIPTADYKMITETNDYNFVIGHFTIYPGKIKI